MRHVIKRILVVLATGLLLTLLSPHGALAFGAKDVVTMTKDGVPDSLIITKIEHSGVTFRLEAGDLADLAKAGVSDDVVGAMLRTEDRGSAPALGSREQPFLLPGVEASALRPEHRPTDRLEFRADAVSGSLYGVMAGARTAGSRIGLTKTAPWSQETNFIAGAGVSLGRPEIVFLESGRVTLRDPIDVAASGGTGPEYWATSAGFQISF